MGNLNIRELLTKIAVAQKKRKETNEEVKELVDKMLQNSMEKQAKLPCPPTWLVKKELLDDMQKKIEKRQNSPLYKIKNIISRNFVF